MAFLNRETGELTFTDGLQLRPGLPLETIGLSAPDGAVLRLESRSVQGGRLIPFITVRNSRVHSVSVCVGSIGGRVVKSTEKQRAFLFSRFHLRDPFPDTLGPIAVRCPFGELTLSCDPLSGRAEARLIYAR